MTSPRRLLLRSLAFVVVAGRASVAGAGPRPAPTTTGPVRVAPALNAARILVRVQAFYAGLDHLHARFHQEVTNATFGRRDLSDGSVWLARPGKMRWDYRGKKTKKTKASVARSFISNGQDLFVVDHDNQQVIKKQLGRDLLPTAVTFLVGQGDLAAEFVPLLDVSGTYGTKADHVLALTPKVPTTAYQRLYLVVDPATFQVEESIIVDAAGNTNRFRFGKADVAATVDPAWFEFAPASVPTFRVIDASAPATP